MLTMLSVETAIVVPLFLSTKARRQEESWNIPVGASPAALSRKYSDELYVRGFIPISKLCDDVRGAAICLELFTRQDDVTSQIPLSKSI
jgi:hypothetical protein